MTFLSICLYHFAFFLINRKPFISFCALSNNIGPYWAVIFDFHISFSYDFDFRLMKIIWLYFDFDFFGSYDFDFCLSNRVKTSDIYRCFSFLCSLIFFSINQLYIVHWSLTKMLSFYFCLVFDNHFILYTI